MLTPAALLSVAFWYQDPLGSRKAAPTPQAAEDPVLLAQAPKPRTPAAPGTPAAASAPGAASPAKPVPPAVKAAAARAVAAAAKPKPAIPGEPVVLSIGGDKITKSQFEDILASLPENVRNQFNTPQGRREFARQYAEMKMLANEARVRMNADPKLRTQWSIQVDQALASALMRKTSESFTVDEAAARKYYEGHRTEFETANGRHILIRFQGSQVPVRSGQSDLSDEQALAKANEIRKRIAAGEDFAEIAKKESDDTGSGAAGGALGDFGRGMMVPPFEQAAFSLPVGQVSEAVKSPFGYHIIQIQSRKAKTFEEARPNIEQRKDRIFIDEVKARNVIVLDEGYFGKD